MPSNDNDNRRNTDDENPWERAAASSTPNWSSLSERRTEPTSTAPAPFDPATSCVFRTLLAFHIWDGLLAATMLVLSFAFEKERPHHLCQWFACAWAILLFVRAIVAVLMGGWYFAGQISLYLSIGYAIMSPFAGGYRQEALHCFQEVFFVAVNAPSWLHPQAIWILLLVLSVIESARWALVQQWRQVLVEEEELLDLLQSQRGNQYNGRNRPWWWQGGRNNSATNQMNDPLLESNSNHQRSRPRFYWPWSSQAGGNDDASVDYASLNEDWASRSEDDPFWWTREEGQRESQQTSTGAVLTSSDNPSWATGGKGGEVV